MTDLVTLAIGIDSTDVKRGVDELDNLTVAGGKAEKAVDRLGGSASQSGKFISGAAQQAAEYILRFGQMAGATSRAADASRAAMDATAGLAQQADNLRAKFDPIYAAEKRHADTLILADKALRQSLLTQQQFNDIVGRSKTQMTAHIQGLEKATAASGAARAGMQQLSFQLGDAATMWAMGAKPMQIFASQAGQVIGAIQLMTGGTSRLAAFLGGPWGVAATMAATVLIPLIGKLTETEQGMEDVQFASGALGNAQGILGGAVDLTTGKINTQSSALVALARAQLAVARVQAETRQAEARSQIQGAGKLGFMDSIMHIFDSNKAVIGRGQTQDIMKSLLAGATDGNSAIKTLENLNKAGMITDETFTKAAAAVANFGVEGENLKTYEAAQRVLDGVGTATDRAIILKSPKAVKALKEQKSAMDDAAEAAERLAIAQKNALASQMDDMIKGQKGWQDDMPSFLEQEKTASDQADSKVRAEAENMANALDVLRAKLDPVSQRVDEVARSMRDAFGSVGGAIGDVITVLDEYGKRQAIIGQQTAMALAAEKVDNQLVATLRKRAIDNQLSGTVALLGASKSLFNEKSKGYKAMEAAEKALAIVQLARTAIDVAGGAAKMFASLGPFGFPAVAAMLGVMASLGFKGGGGGGQSFNLKDYQASMGTGSVLGDGKAKSDSISQSLDLLASNSDKELEYGNAMVRSLRSIENNIGNLAGLLAKQLGVTGGAFDTSGLGLGSVTSLGGLQGGIFKLASKIPIVGGLLGGIGKALFGTTVTKTLLDQGIVFDPETVGSILSGGIDGQTYQDIQTKKKKKMFGITTSNKTKISTSYGGLDEQAEQQVGLLIGSMRDSIVSAAGLLGVEGAGAVLDAFKINLGKISLKDLTGAEIQEQLNAVFSKLGDDMAAAALPALATFQKVGEGQFETLMRLAKDYQTVDVQMQSIGRAFGMTGAASIALRENLIDLFGSLDAFVDQTQFYRDNFLTEAERIAPVMNAVNGELSRLGLSGVDTIDKFKAVVNGLDLTTEAGQNLYAALMALAPGFAAVEKYQSAQAQAAAALAKTRAGLEINLLDAQGKTSEALALRRKMELEAMDESLRPLQQQIYAEQDLAATRAKAAEQTSQRRSLEIALLDAMGQTAAATALRRKAELEAMDATLRPLQMQIYAWQDLATAQQTAADKVASAKEVLTQAYTREASALQDTAAKFKGFASSIADFRKGLASGVIGGSYDQTRARFENTATMAQFGNEASLEAFTGDATAFLEASRNRASSAVDLLAMWPVSLLPQHWRKLGRMVWPLRRSSSLPPSRAVCRTSSTSTKMSCRWRRPSMIWRRSSRNITASRASSTRQSARPPRAATRSISIRSGPSTSGWPISRQTPTARLMPCGRKCRPP
jgi:hypothetical protein